MDFLIYASTATQSLSQEELLNLLSQAREFNTRHQLTGLLLYSPGQGDEAGTFVQILEGPAKTLDDIYSKIKNDGRHKDCTVLKRGTTYQRRFADWSMGFRDLSNLKPEEVPGFNTIFQQKWTLTQVLLQPDPVLQLLYSFSGV